MYLKTIAPAPPIDSISEHFVNTYLTATFKDVNDSGGTYIENGAHADWAQITRRLKLWRDAASPKIKDGSLSDALTQWQHRQRQLQEKKTAELLAYTGPNDEMDKLFSIISEGRQPLDIVVMRHWLWQVKRKLCGLPVTYHMMPVWYGPQAAGKSETIKKLMAPLGADFSEPGVNFSVFVDERQAPILARKYAFLLEEMAWSDRADVETLKNIITSTVKTYRQLFTNQMVTIPQNGTFIGTTNLPLNNAIFDTTGMRRFWQIDIVKPADWQPLNEINWLKIWQSVDEAAECLLLPYLNEISRVQQETLTSKTNTAIFATEYCDIGEYTQADTLLSQFRAWEEIHDPRRKTAARHFFQQLLLIPGVERQYRNHGRAFYSLKPKKTLSLVEEKVGAA